MRTLFGHLRSDYAMTMPCLYHGYIMEEERKLASFRTGSFKSYSTAQTVFCSVTPESIAGGSHAMMMTGADDLYICLDQWSV